MSGTVSWYKGSSAAYPAYGTQVHRSYRIESTRAVGVLHMDGAPHRQTAASQASQASHPSRHSAHSNPLTLTKRPGSRALFLALARRERGQDALTHSLADVQYIHLFFFWPEPSLPSLPSILPPFLHHHTLPNRSRSRSRSPRLAYPLFPPFLLSSFPPFLSCSSHVFHHRRTHSLRQFP